MSLADRVSDVRFLRHLHGAIALAALAMTPVSALTGLRDSVPYLVAISMLALVLSEFGAWQAARAEEEAASADEVAKRVYEMLERNADKLWPRG